VDFPLFGLSGSTQIARGSKELLLAYRNSPALRKIVSLIANQLAAVELYLIDSKRKNAKKTVKSLGKAPAENQITEHPYLDFLYRGSPALRGVSALKLSATYYLLKGEFFWLLMPDLDGSPGWMVLPPTWVREVPTLAGGDFKVCFGNSTKMVTFPREAIVWVRDPDVIDPYGRGYGVGDALRDELDTDEYAAGLMRTVLANRGMVTGVLSATDASGKAAKESLRREWERHHRGAINAGKTVVMDKDVKYTPLAQAFSELQLLPLREQESRYVEETFCVPPELFGKVQNSNRASATIAYTNFAINTLVPYHTMFAMEVGAQTLPLFDKSGRLSLWYESPVPEDLETRKEMIGKSPQSFTANEIREVAGKEPKPWGNVRYVPGNLLEIPAPEGGGRKARELEAGTEKKSLA
jgi:HK97 family phage portal protein